MINGRGNGVEFGGPRTHNQTSRNLNSFMNSMEGAANNSLHFHSINQRKITFLQLISFPLRELMELIEDDIITVWEKYKNHLLLYFLMVLIDSLTFTPYC